MFYAIFDSACPFINYFRYGSGSKSFVRIVEGVKHAAAKFNFVEGVDGRAADFLRIAFYDEGAEVARLVFQNEDNKIFTVSIVTHNFNI